MTDLAMSLGSLHVAHARLFLPWRGRWLADVDVDLGTSGTAPSGAQKLTIGSATLSGTVDPDRSGFFAQKASLRLLGGGGGWQKDVPARHYHNDAGVKSSNVLSTTASDVGETIVDAAPSVFGIDFVRPAGAASQVLELLEWRVDLDGTTRTGTRTTPTTPASLQVLEWDGDRQRADFACDEIVLPGTQVTDTRFGTITLRDVEQTFGDDGARGTAWCGTAAASRLVGALTAVVRQRGHVAFLAAYRYRVLSQGSDGRLTLQAVERLRGLPDMIPLSVWPGMAGLSATYTPGTEVLVEFIAGDPGRPVVTGFQSGASPQVLTLDATGTVFLTAAATDFVALASLVNTQFTALKNAFNAWTPVPNDGGAALKAQLTSLIGGGWPASVAAGKVKAA